MYHHQRGQEWQIQEAKQKFSQLVRCAEKEGPQKITKNGGEAVWLISASDYHNLKKEKKGIIEFFQRIPSSRN